MDQLFQFEGRNVRTFVKDNEIWFIAKDICEVLEITWQGTGSISHVPEEWRGVVSDKTPSGIQSLLIFNEKGLYFFLNRSDKPKALPFQKWVAGEVIPSIRKTGEYVFPNNEPSDDELRIDTRDKMSDLYKEEHGALKKHAGVNTSQGHAKYTNSGYAGLYELESSIDAANRVAKKKGIILKKTKTGNKTSDNILNYMGLEELGINLYHRTQAKAQLERGKYTPEEANNITRSIGKEIVADIRRRGNRPPKDIPFEEHINDVKKRVNLENKSKEKIDQNIIEEVEDLVYAVNGKAYSASLIEDMTIVYKKTPIENLWVIALIICYFDENGSVTTGELQAILPEIYPFSEEDKANSPTKKEPFFKQKIRNIRINGIKNPSGFIKRGFAEAFGGLSKKEGGFKITRKGIDYIEKILSSYLDSEGK